MDKERKTILCQQIKEELLRRHAKENYADYVEYTHMGRWIRGNAALYICEQVQRFIESKSDNAFDILIISMPPQHGKSMTITSTLPSWYLGNNPQKRIIEISYSEEFAMQFGRHNKQKIYEFGQQLFGVELSKTPNTATEFETTHGGVMISRGIMSGVTGRACDLMIIDDPIKNRMEADSETYRNRIYAEWENSFKTRLSAGAKVIIIQTRWHDDDLAGRIIKRERSVKVLNLPCECEGVDDPLGRNIGDSLAPEIGKNNAWLADFKSTYTGKEGSRAWNALFQGRPSKEQGNILKKEWWKYYSQPISCEHIVLSVDAAFKNADDNDYVAIQAWGKKDGKIYLLHAIKKHLDFSETIKAIVLIKNKFKKVSRILIEDKANGSAIIQLLKKTMSNIVPIEPQGGKVARVNAVSGIIEAGNVYLPDFEEFTEDFVDECSAFPFGKNDDQVDCMSQALNHLIYVFNNHNFYVEEDPLKAAFKIDKKKSNLLGRGEKNSVI